MKIILITVVVIIVAIVGAFVVMGIQSRGGDSPGMSGTRLRPCGSDPNCVSSDAPADSAGFVAPFSFRTGEEMAEWTDLVEIIVQVGGELRENAPPYLSATFSSKIFGFVDDFECVIDRDAGVIHVRSGSRVGYSDLDVNRQRVERIRRILIERRD